MNQQITTTRPVQISLRLITLTIVETHVSGQDILYEDKEIQGADITEVLGPLDHKLQTTETSKTSKFIKLYEKLKKKINIFTLPFSNIPLSYDVFYQ